MKLLALIISISVILVSTILQYSEAAQTTSTISTRRKRIARRKLEEEGLTQKGTTTKESTTKEPHDHSHAPKQMKKTTSPRPSVSISASPSLSTSPSVAKSISPSVAKSIIPSQIMSKQPSTSPSKSPVVTSNSPITSQYDEWEIPSNPDSCEKDSDCLMNYYCTKDTFICCSNDEICDSINIEKGIDGIGEEQEETQGLDKVKIIQYGMFGALVVGGIFMVMRNRRGGDI